MHKSLIIVLMSIHLFGNTEMGQLLKLPQLISHYFQHHRQDGHISFVEFLAMHYGGDDGTNADDDIDQKLPYHSSSTNSFSVLYSFVGADIQIAAPDKIDDDSRFGYVQPGHSSKHVMLILQPPRFL